MDIIFYALILGLVFVFKKEIKNFWCYWKTRKQEKKKSFFKDLASIISLNLWVGIIVVAAFSWIPNEMTRKTADEYTMTEVVVISVFEELVFRILPGFVLLAANKVRKYNQVEQNNLNYVVGIATSLGFGLLHTLNFANPINALPLVITQFIGGLSCWYLQRRYFLGTSIGYHLTWNVMLKLL